MHACRQYENFAYLVETEPLFPLYYEYLLKVNIFNFDQTTLASV